MRALVALVTVVVFPIAMIYLLLLAAGIVGASRGRKVSLVLVGAGARGWLIFLGGVGGSIWAPRLI